eukprot:jgi/Bigna1/90828/estExt_fgenesh1_pg.C_800081
MHSNGSSGQEESKGCGGSGGGGDREPANTKNSSSSDGGLGIAQEEMSESCCFRANADDCCTCLFILGFSMKIFENLREYFMFTSCADDKVVFTSQKQKMEENSQQQSNKEEGKDDTIEFRKNELVRYKEKETVTLVGVHPDPEETYYTIR